MLSILIFCINFFFSVFPQPVCPIDIVIAIDNSACFRDHHGKMMRFIKKLVRRIGRSKTIYYGAEATRLALMQVCKKISMGGGILFMGMEGKLQVLHFLSCVHVVQ